MLNINNTRVKLKFLLLIFGIVTDYGLDSRGIRVRPPGGGASGASVLHSVQKSSGAHPASSTYNGYRETDSPRVKRPWLQADHSPASSVVILK
jgi:hypothetical protein